MEIHSIDNFTNGWFIGNFNPSVLQTDQFELGYKYHKSGEQCSWHYHKEITEINLLIDGSMKMQNKVLKKGDIFILHPYEVSDPEFITDCHIIVLKTPSIPKDKYLI